MLQQPEKVLYGPHHRLQVEGYFKGDLTLKGAFVAKGLSKPVGLPMIMALNLRAKVFTKLDATSSSWKILNTFSGGCCRCWRAVQAMYTVCHADDILVYGDSRAQHDERRRQVLEKLREEGLTLNGKKCEFSKDSITFLGHRVSVDGVIPDPEKIKAIQKVPAPTDVKGVKRLTGMANYLSKFLPHLASYTNQRSAVRKERVVLRTATRRGF